MTIRNALLVLAVLAFGSTPALPAQTVTAFKTGEQTTGMTKQCFYDALGNEYTRTIGSVELCALSIQVQLSPTPARAPEPETRTVTAFKTGEQATGMTKQCFYDALGNQYTRTIGSVELCPLSIRVRLSGPCGPCDAALFYLPRVTFLLAVIGVAAAQVARAPVHDAWTGALLSRIHP